jgi:hypothetical protein
MSTKYKAPQEIDFSFLINGDNKVIIIDVQMIGKVEMLMHFIQEGIRPIMKVPDFMPLHGYL